MIDPNKPLKSPDSDKLGYKLFSQDLARNIVKMTPSDGFVIGLTGPWGSGKSTSLFFVESYLTERKKELSLNDGEIPLILHFNPWMFSGQSDIVIQFFIQLKEEFPKSTSYEILFKIHPDILSNLNTIFTKLTELAIATGFPDPTFLQKIIISTKGAIDLRKILDGYISQKKETQKNVLGLKKDIETLLTDIDFKILIIIDDIDRLTQEEIRQLFRGIKSLADFPNLIYLLAYDESVVLDALKEVSTSESNQNRIEFARNYLEKIVQFSIPLPTPEKWSLTQYFESELDKIFAGTDSNYLDRKHWRQSYSNGLSYFLTNPRKVKNLINSLKFLYPSVKNEVNFVDFVLLDSLRIFKPELYLIIRENPQYFLLQPIKEAWAGGIKEDIFIKFHEKWMNGLSQSDQNPVIRIIFNLFPIVANKFKQKRDLSDEIILYYESDSLSKGRICSNEDTFSKYFRYTLQPSDISLKDLRFELSSQIDPQHYIQKFTFLINQETESGCTKASEYLEKLSEYLDETTPPETISAILKAFFNIADQLMILKDHKSKGLGARKNEDLIMDITEKGLFLINKEERMLLLKKEIQSGKSISYISKIILEISPSDRFKDYRFHWWQRKIVDELQSQQLEKLFMRNLQENVKDNFDLLERPYIDTILLIWRLLTPDFEQESGFINVPDFINDFITKKDLVIGTILNVMNNGYSQSLDLSSFIPEISKEQFIEIIKNALEFEILRTHEEDISLGMSGENIKKVEMFLNPEK